MIPNVFLATTTWNCVDIVDRFLGHVRDFGVQRAYVIDFHSDDGTREVLQSAQWRDFVVMEDLPSLTGQDTSNTLLETIRREHPGAWALFCDPDEFLVSPRMHVQDLFPADWRERDAFAIRRFNMTARRSLAQRGRLEADAIDQLTLRVCRQHVRSQAERVSARLDPPWIYTAILDKTLVRVDAATGIAPGDHGALTTRQLAPTQLEDAYLLHYPIRSYANFHEKVGLYQRDHEANPGHPGWHQARWIELLKAGRLREEYLEQFVADDELAARVAAGAVVPEHRVRESRLSRSALHESTRTNEG